MKNDKKPLVMSNYDNDGWFFWSFVPVRMSFVLKGLKNRCFMLELQKKKEKFVQ